MYVSTPGSKAGWTAGRVIACVLLLVSFLTVFLPWTTIYGEYKGQKYTLSDMICINKDISPYEMQSGLYWYFREIVDDASYYGIEVDIDAEKTADALWTLLNGKLTPVNTAWICTAAGSCLRQLKPYLVSSGELGDLDFNYPEDRIRWSFYTDVPVKATVAAVATWVFLFLFFLTFVWAAYSLITNRRNGLIPYFISSLIQLAVFIAMTVAVNRALSSSGRTLDGIFDTLSPSNMSFADLRLFHLTVAGFFCAFLPVAGYFLAGPGHAASAKAPVSRPDLRSSGHWRCISCGQANSADAAFCMRCGAQKPAPLRCARCGRPAGEGELYCPVCGAKVGAPASGPVPAPRPAPKSDELWTTPKDL